MIHTLRGVTPPRRRIAIVELPRLGRLRSIGAETMPNSAVEAWTTISDQTPTSAENWLSFVMAAQTQKRETTPGTLVYTPAPGSFPAPVQAAWNSWGIDACNPDGTAIDPTGAPAIASSAAAAIPAAPAADHSWILLAAGLLAGLVLAGSKR